MSDATLDPEKSPDMGTAFVAILMVALLVVLGTPKLIEARRHGNEASAIGALRTITTSEAAFRERDEENDGNLDYGMLSELARTGLVEPELGSGRERGYVIQATYSFCTSEFLWFATANPETPGVTGDRYFSTNQAGVIFYTTDHALSLDTDTCLLPNNGDVTSGQ